MGKYDAFLAVVAAAFKPAFDALWRAIAEIKTANREIVKGGDDLEDKLTSEQTFRQQTDEVLQRNLDILQETIPDALIAADAAHPAGSIHELIDALYARIAALEAAAIQGFGYGGYGDNPFGD